MKTKRLNVFIIDRNDVVRRALTELINHENDLHVCGESNNGGRALEDIARLEPDVAIVDLSLASAEGVGLIRLLRRLSRPPEVLAVSMHGESIFAADARRAGAKGYLMKARAAEKIVDAVRAVARGEAYPSKDSSMGSKRRNVSWK